MKLGYTILYVLNVVETIHFYEKAFDLKINFIHESGQYGEMQTGATTLAFASEELSKLNGLSIRPNRAGEITAGFELAFVAEDVNKSYEVALQAGAEAIHTPIQKPWGQTVAYVKDPNGILIEICSVMDK